ncbi:MAG: YbjN domain-containing protein [Blastocatellia bacterium]
MKRSIAMPILAAALLGLAFAAPQQKGISIQTVKVYLDKMEMQSVPHPRSADTLVVPSTDNQNADRIDLYVERRADQTLVLTAYPKFKGRYFNLARVADREKLFQRLLEANHRAFATFFVDNQGDIGARFTFSTEDGVGYETFRSSVIELLRITDEYVPTLDGFMRNEQTDKDPLKKP